MKRILLLIVGIVGGMFLVNSYAIAQTDPANPKLGAAPESDKNIGPGPNDATIGSDKKPTNRRSPASKEKKHGSHKSKGQTPEGKNQAPAQSGGRTTEAPGG